MIREVKSLGTGRYRWRLVAAHGATEWRTADYLKDVFALAESELLLYGQAQPAAFDREGEYCGHDC